MSDWLRKCGTKAILLIAAFMAAAAIGATFAWQTWNLDMTNVLTAHNTEVHIEESFDPETGDKHVWFKNTGTSSVFLRISFTEFWKAEDKRGKDQENNTDLPYFPPTVLSNTIGGQEIAIKYRGDSPDAEERWRAQWTDGETWWDGGDGWFYYKRVLRAGESTKEILTKVLFNETLLEENTLYKTAHYQLYFKAEAVQCSDGSNTLNSDEVNEDATKKLFGKIAKVGDDGITVTWK